ncbi:VOC family protein [Sphingomonas lacunae]|uniref:VOC family protein n=1 Tax=Sphingomonas lacunae TaxID=2698828 RepID=A0A6M4ATF7_9SPHN|nr:VOC family protein [Sphingomonas lacunae]QJQ32006.1 VOC family protein [Sphingomonas lacunae]
MTILTNAKAVTFILTGNRETARAFYTGTLGLNEVGEDEYSVTYDLAGTEMRLTSIADHVAGPHTVMGWDVTDIRTAIAELKAKGLTFEIYEGFGQDPDGVWTDPGSGTMIAWFNDPEGNNLSLKQAGG